MKPMGNHRPEVKNWSREETFGHRFFKGSLSFSKVYATHNHVQGVVLFFSLRFSRSHIPVSPVDPRVAFCAGFSY
jgi:hypothetical protein